MGAGPRSFWRTAAGDLTLDRPRIMGILNVTPDSFWDGGRHAGTDAALRQAERLLSEGADLLDVGGESTRPGAATVSDDDELERVIPVIRALVRRWPDALISIDTVKAAVARAALDEGAAVVNDVSGGRIDPALPGVAAASGAGLVLMHSRGGVERMASYDTAEYGDDPVAEMVAELRDRDHAALAAGVDPSSIVLDPGLGFSKRTEHSVAALAGLGRFLDAGRPILVGPSRKRFVGEDLPAEMRLPGTIAACVAALERGARLFRVHDAGPVRRALDLADAVVRHPGNGGAE